MKTYLEITTELKLNNRSHKLAEMLREMPVSSYWGPILVEVSEKLREHGNGEIHVDACFVMDEQRNTTDQDGNPLPGHAVLHKE